MSDVNNRKDDLQDYNDLLDEYGVTDDIDFSAYSEEGFSDEYPLETEKNKNQNNGARKIDMSFFNNDEKVVAPPPMVKGKKKESSNKLVRWFKKLPKWKKAIISIVAILLALLIILTTVFGIFVAQKFSIMGDKIDSYTGDDSIIYDDLPIPDDIEIDIGSAGFKQSLIDWATTGNDKHMSSKNVINVLLIGADSRNGTNTGNTDVMMLLSLNKKTKELKLISFFRDSYLYIEGAKGKNYCSKLNAAFSMGGPQILIKTIENNYKIDIDNYVMVNFESFSAIIDEMGGVQVDVQQYEADYNYKKFQIELPVGKNVTLNGKQALCFCRIRGCDADGDVSRTRRQRQVIDSIIDRVKSASVSDLNKYIDLLLPYVQTGYSGKEILTLGISAVTGGWAKYKRSQLQMPPEDCRISGDANMWIWVVDYELAAHKLQMEIYGESNIKISEDRTSIIDVYRGADYNGSSGGGSSTGNAGASDYINNNVVTTEGTTAPVPTTESTLTETGTDTNTDTDTIPDNGDVSESNTDVSVSETQSDITTPSEGSSDVDGNNGETEAATDNVNITPTQPEAVTIQIENNNG